MAAAPDVTALQKEVKEDTVIIKELKEQLAAAQKRVYELEHSRKLVVAKAHHPSTGAKEGEIIEKRIAAAEPYPWPWNGIINPHNTAIVCIDMQNDFCAPGGYVDHMGYDLKPIRALIPNIQKVFKAARAKGYTMIHTREGHLPDLSDCPANKLWRSKRIHGGIGDAGAMGRMLIRGTKGQDIIPELYPEPNEIVIDKPGKGSFCATSLELILNTRHIQNLILMGVTTDVCVHTTMREANDRGFECIMLEDCVATTDYGDHLFALKSIKMSGGIFGATTISDRLIEIL